MFTDIRLAMRSLAQNKAWTAVVVISVALGIGANTAIFSAVNGLLLRKLPVADPDSLVRLKHAGPNDMRTSSSDYGYLEKEGERDVRGTFSYPMFQTFVAENRTMAELAAGAPVGRLNVVVDGRADLASAFMCTGTLHRMLGVTARLGRTLLPDDDTPASPPVAAVSYPFWQSRFGGDEKVIGKVIRINATPVTIVGVLPPAYTGIHQPIGNAHDLALPLAVYPQLHPGDDRLAEPTNWWLLVMGRLKPGMTAAHVRANLEVVFQHTARAGLDSYLSSLPDDKRSTAVNRNRKHVPDLRVDSGARGTYDAREAAVRATRILGAIVLLVLLLVCANVANLLLSRAATRQKEISVRLSLGATRIRLVRQLLTESLLLAAIGGSIGLVIGHWGRRLLPTQVGEPAPLDGTVLAFVLLVTAATGIVFGIAPALRATGVNVNAALKDHARGVAPSRTRLGKSLLMAQVAISLVLLVGAGLFLRTLHNLKSVNVGFNPENLVLFRVSPGLNRYDATRTRAFYQELLTRLRTVPGVRAAALSNLPLLSGGANTTGAYVQGRTYVPGAKEDNGIHRLVISPAFFETMQVPLLLGRPFTEHDHPQAQPVVIINESAARKFFPGENPIGRRFGTSVETAGELEVVGILRDVKYNSLRDAAPPTMYVPYTQARVPTAIFEVRTAGDPLSAVGAIREAVRQIDAGIPITDVSTQAEQIERRMIEEKTFAQAASLFGALALVVAAVGLFGLMSYSVSRRTNEIGVRMALGAQRGNVLWLVMRESMVPVAAGVVIGVGAAMAGSRLVEALLFGLSATDATTIAAAVAVMMAVSMAAAYAPARRAARIDPMVALRYE